MNIACVVGESSWEPEFVPHADDPAHKIVGLNISAQGADKLVDQKFYKFQGADGKMVLIVPTRQRS